VANAAENAGPGPAVSGRPVCAGSGIVLKPGDKTVEWHGKYFLVAHFSCTTCKKGLATIKSIMNIGGKPHCEPCGKKAFIKHNLTKKSEPVSSLKAPAFTLPPIQSDEQEELLDPKSQTHKGTLRISTSNVPVPNSISPIEEEDGKEKKAQAEKKREKKLRKESKKASQSNSNTPHKPKDKSQHHSKKEKDPEKEKETQQSPALGSPAVPAWKARLLEKKKSVDSLSQSAPVYGSKPKTISSTAIEEDPEEHNPENKKEEANLQEVQRNEEEELKRKQREDRKQQQEQKRKQQDEDRKKAIEIEQKRLETERKKQEEQKQEELKQEELKQQTLKRKQEEEQNRIEAERKKKRKIVNRLILNKTVWKLNEKNKKNLNNKRLNNKNLNVNKMKNVNANMKKNKNV